MPESSCFPTPFESQSSHGYWTMLKSSWQHFYPKFPLIEDTLSWKTSVLATFGILWLFGNTLTNDHMDSRHFLRKTSATCSKAIISKTEKTFSEIFIAFSQSTQKFVHFHKKDQLDSLNILEVTQSKKSGYLNARNLLFLNTLPESTCSGVVNTAKITMAALSS